MSRVGIAVALLKQGQTAAHVAKQMGMGVTEVEMLARECGVRKKPTLGEMAAKARERALADPEPDEPKIPDSEKRQMAKLREANRQAKIQRMLAEYPTTETSVLADRYEMSTAMIAYYAKRDKVHKARNFRQLTGARISPSNVTLRTTICIAHAQLQKGDTAAALLTLAEWA